MQSVSNYIDHTNLNQTANNFNIDSILVKSGIHKSLKNINNIIKNHQIFPNYIINNFSI